MNECREVKHKSFCSLRFAVLSLLPLVLHGALRYEVCVAHVHREEPPNDGDTHPGRQTIATGVDRPACPRSHLDSVSCGRLSVVRAPARSRDHAAGVLCPDFAREYRVDAPAPSHHAQRDGFSVWSGPHAAPAHGVPAVAPLREPCVATHTSRCGALARVFLCSTPRRCKAIELNGIQSCCNFYLRPVEV